MEEIKQHKMEVFDVIARIIARCSNGDIALPEIRCESSLMDDLNLNSASMVDVVLDLENHFKIQITGIESQLASTVGDLQALVLRKQLEAPKGT